MHLLGLGFYMFLLVVIFIGMLFVRIRFEVGYRREGRDDHLRVEMTSLKGLVRYRTEVPVIDIDRYFLEPVLKMEADIESVVSHPVEDKGMIVRLPVAVILRKLPIYIKQGLAYLDRYRTALRKLLRSIRFHHLTWSAEIGLGDPAWTGIVTGLLWGINGVVYRVFVSNAGEIKKPPVVSVRPCFNDTCLRLDFHCIFDMRIGHIIIAGLKFARYRLKQ